MAITVIDILTYSGKVAASTASDGVKDSGACVGSESLLGLRGSHIDSNDAL